MTDDMVVKLEMHYSVSPSPFSSGGEEFWMKMGATDKLPNPTSNSTIIKPTATKLTEKNFTLENPQEFTCDEISSISSSNHLKKARLIMF